MGLILWIDAQILKFFTKIAKDFNWLTGKDNFFLAGLVVLVMLIYPPLFKFCGYKIKYWYWLSVFALPYLRYTRMEMIITQLEQLAGVKHAYRLVIRFLNFLLVVIGLLFYWLLKSIYPLCSSGLAVVWVYLCHVDQPPFKKSQALQKIKGLFTGPADQLELRPAPVTVLNN